MKIPVICPVCGANHIQPIERQSLNSGDERATGKSEPLAFRCGRGHVFALTENELSEDENKD